MELFGLERRKKDRWFGHMERILTGLNVVQRWKWKEPSQGNVWGSHGGMVSSMIWKDREDIQLSQKMEEEN